MVFLKVSIKLWQYFTTVGFLDRNPGDQVIDSIVEEGYGTNYPS